MLVIDPDHVIDVTEVAECIMPSASFPDLAILRRFAPRTPSAAALAGMAVNTAFDLLVQDDRLDDEALLKKSLADKGLALAALSTEADAIVDRVRSLLPAVRQMRQRWAHADIRVEPHVIAPTIGLQGRFDILVTEGGETDLIEMKAGSPPSSIRANHAAQVSAYALMFELMHGKPPRKTLLWYVAAERDPLRPIPNMRALQERVIDIRNAIVTRQREISQRQFHVLKGFTGTSLQGAGLAAEFERPFAEAYRNADAASRTAAQAWLSFLQNEVGRSASSMWKQTLSEKLAGSHVIGGLRLDVGGSDLDTMHVLFRSESVISDRSLRIGDMICVRPQVDHGQSAVEMFKGTIRGMTDATVEVSLRNKHLHDSDLAHPTWIIEPDVSDAGLRHQWSSVMRFLQAPLRKRHLLLGLLPPSTLNPLPSTLVDRAVSCSDYFIIQGPPGTGKTSTILRDIVLRLSTDPSERILILAFTNRAVNEICDVLDKALPPHSYLRHGTKSGISTRHVDNSIPLIANALAPSQLRKKIEECRILVSTIHSMHSSAEILSFGEFSTVVVDEAAQVLEPQIVGLLARVRRFIMIGDHMQLPAVVTQGPEARKVDSPVLAPAHLTDLGMSMFERLLRCANANGWDHVHGTLTAQGRMHRDVMRFASEAFYGGRLTTMMPWQDDQAPTPWHDVIPSRAAFRPVQAQGQQAEAEASEIVRLVQQICDRCDASGVDMTIGVITPFRVQNRRVLTLLPQHLRDRVTIDTVERFQGSQRDIVIYGTAVSDPTELSAIRADVLTDQGLVDRKLNVAATRARHQFILVGDPETLRISPAYAAAMQMLNCT